MASSSSTSDTKNLMEIKRFDGKGFDLWQDRMTGILFLKDCEDALLEAKQDDMPLVEWEKLNKKAIAYIKLALGDKILNDVKGLCTGF